MAHGSVASSVAGGVDSSLYPIAVLIDELRHDDLQLRLNSIRNIGTIATALGPERTREELIPFLQEIVDDDDEVLMTLAEQLGEGVDYVGGPAYGHILIGPLEELCNVEEIAVRDKAVTSLKAVAAKMSSEQIMRHFCALIGRLSSHDWFTSRISVCSLFPCALPKVGETKQDDLMRTYFRLCGDDTPMVRRQAANCLGAIADVLRSDDLMEELFEVFEKLSKDDQDSVRILAVGNCMALGRLNTSAKWHSKILPIVKACAEDKSWRVRYMVADHVKAFCNVFRSDAIASVVPLYVRLLSDQEVEVRSIAAARLSAVAEVQPTKEFLETLMPSIEKLTQPREQSPHVRASLAGSVLGLTPVFGPKLVVDSLLQVVLQLIRDDSPDVRLKLMAALGELASVSGTDVLSQSLLPSIRELGKDRQWRVRLAVLDCIPSLSKTLGVATFTDELSSLFTVWLVDPVYSVRDATAQSFLRLVEALGSEWYEANIVPQLTDIVTHKNYLYRISVLLCAGALSEVATALLLERHIVPMVVSMAADPVPNVRLNVAKTIRRMHAPCKKISPRSLDNHVLPALRRLLEDKDPDVQFFAKATMTEVGTS